MAAGYARASGRVGVCMVTSGPGATNTVTPVRDCLADSVPMVVICGQVPAAAIGTDAFQEAPVSNIMGSVAKHVFLVTDPEQLEATIRTAFEIARTGRPGPGRDRRAEGRAELAGRVQGRGPARRARLSQAHERPAMRTRSTDERGDAFFDMLGESERPLIYAGGGVVNGERVRRAASIRRRIRHPGGHHADGHRRRRHDRSALDAHARHARHRLRQLRGGGLRLPDRGRRALRRPRGRRAGEVRAEREADRAPRHRRVRDQQGEARAVGHVGLLPRGARRRLARARSARASAATGPPGSAHVERSGSGTR